MSTQTSTSEQGPKTEVGGRGGSSIVEKRRRGSEHAGKFAAAAAVLLIVAGVAYEADQVYNSWRNRATRDTEQGIVNTLGSDGIHDISVSPYKGSFWAASTIRGLGGCIDLKVINPQSDQSQGAPGAMYLYSGPIVKEGYLSTNPRTGVVEEQVITHPSADQSIMNGTRYANFIAHQITLPGSKCDVAVANPARPHTS